MPTHLVNLDALIEREDFETTAGEASQSRRLADQLKVEDLERTYFKLLRKPDFQRETSNWSPDKVVDFVRSFLDGDLIPAVIMWWSSLNGTVFVIDGAHRLSALMAWVHEDYGAGRISLPFFGHDIPPEQKRLAKITHQLMDQEIGPYEKLKYILQNSEQSSNTDTLRRARNMAAFKVDLQWVEGNAATAEKSFFKINGNATILDPTELGIIKARRKPNAIATRALMHAGTGHKYWSGFGPEVRSEIEKLSRDVYDGLFKPILESPIKTTDLPIAGQGYSADSFKMIFDFVNLVNHVTPSMWQEKQTKRRKKEVAVTLADDENGSKTVEFLEVVRAASWLISGDYTGSLGLHPVVYFYGANGRFQPTAFLATIKFVQGLKARDEFIPFTDVRHDFEEFLVKHRHFVNHLGHSYGSRTRPLEALVAMYEIIFSELRMGHQTDADIVDKLLAEPRLKDLKGITEESKHYRKSFSKDEKSTAYLRAAIDQPIRCNECNARLHSRSISMDHEIRQEDGGRGNPENARPTHPFCNSGFKESQHAKTLKQSP